jgi:membrane protein
MSDLVSDMSNKITSVGVFQVLKDSFKGFSSDKVPKLGASLAFCTVFSFAPLLIVVIYICSLFYGREAIEGAVYLQLVGFVGQDTALQLQQIIKNAAISGSGSLAFILGVIVLLIGATSIFSEVQDSINSIWCLKAKPRLGFKLFIRSRLLSFGILGSLGFLLLVSLAVSAVIEAIGHRLQYYLPHITIVVVHIINWITSLGISTILFAVIFKVLPDASIKWKDVWAGSFTTAVLFNLGKYLISFYISKAHVGTTYGIAGSLVILLVWVYYASLILYFGAEFTKAWAIKYRQGISASPYAVVLEKAQVEHRSHKIK